MLNVEITLPASFFEDEEVDKIIPDEEVEEVAVNDDGSRTFRMSRSAHREMMDSMEEDILEFIDDAIHGDDYASISDIRHDNSFSTSTFTIIAEQEAYENSFDGFISLGLGMMPRFIKFSTVFRPMMYKFKSSWKMNMEKHVPK